MKCTAFPIHAPIIFAPANFTPFRSTSKHARAYHCLTLSKSQPSGKRFSDHSSNQQYSAGDQALLDASDGETRIETLGAGLGAVHDRVAAVQLEAGNAQDHCQGNFKDQCANLWGNTCRSRT